MLLENHFRECVLRIYQCMIKQEITTSAAEEGKELPPESRTLVSNNKKVLLMSYKLLEY